MPDFQQLLLLSDLLSSQRESASDASDSSPTSEQRRGKSTGSDCHTAPADHIGRSIVARFDDHTNTSAEAELVVSSVVHLDLQYKYLARSVVDDSVESVQEGDFGILGQDPF